MPSHPDLPLHDPVDDLDRLLDSLPLEDDVMLLGEVDGLLTGLLFAPEPVAQADWLPLVWSGFEPEEPGDAVARARLTALLTARKTIIAADFRRGAFGYQPIYDIDPLSGDVMWELWLEGFETAIGFYRSAWLALVESPDTQIAEASSHLTILMAAMA